MALFYVRYLDSNKAVRFGYPSKYPQALCVDFPHSMFCWLDAIKVASKGAFIASKVRECLLKVLEPGSPTTKGGVDFSVVVDPVEKLSGYIDWPARFSHFPRW